MQDGEAGGITQQIGATNVPLEAINEQTKMVKNVSYSTSNNCILKNMKCRLIKALWDFLTWTYVPFPPTSNFGVYCFLIPIIPPAKGRLSHFSYIWFQLMHCCFFRKIWRYCSLCSGQWAYVHRLLTFQYFYCKLRLLKPLEYILCWNLTFCCVYWNLAYFWVMNFIMLQT